MLFSKDVLIRLMYTVLVSTLICIVSAAVFFENTVTIPLVLKSIVVGVIIWLLSEILFDTASQLWPHTILPSYAALFLLIAIGTMLGSWVLGVDSLSIILIICLCGEICGFSISIISQRHYKKVLNKQLKEFKEKD